MRHAKILAVTAKEVTCEFNIALSRAAAKRNTSPFEGKTVWKDTSRTLFHVFASPGKSSSVEEQPDDCDSKGITGRCGTYVCMVRGSGPNLSEGRRRPQDAGGTKFCHCVWLVAMTARGARKDW